MNKVQGEKSKSTNPFDEKEATLYGHKAGKIGKIVLLVIAGLLIAMGTGSFGVWQGWWAPKAFTVLSLGIGGGLGVGLLIAKAVTLFNKKVMAYRAS